MNKEAAEDCVERAVKYLAEGKIEKAEKLLNKSITLHRTERAEGEYWVLVLRAWFNPDLYLPTHPHTQTHTDTLNGQC